MMIFVRTGPRFLFLRTENEMQLKEKLVNSLKGKFLSLTAAMEGAREASTIIFLSSPVNKRTAVNGSDVILVPVGSSVTLCSLFNEGMAQNIKRADLGPGLLLQRVPSDGHNVIQKVRENYNAKALELEEAVDQGEANDTVIVFTDRPLSRPVKIKEVLKPALLVNRPVPVMYRLLRQEAIRYYTAGLESGQWHEVRINIYDRNENYEIHHQRLVLALEDLEAGLILGELWTKDHALALFSVVAFQIRLFTTVEPLELKKILMGLEYNSQGYRFVDIDLYYRRSKIERNQVISKLPKNVVDHSTYFRELLFSRLSEETRKKLFELEKKLA